MSKRRDFDAVIFDMDGIIFDSERAVTECWIELAQKYGIEGIEESCRACLGVNAAATRKIMLSRYGQDFPYDDYAREASRMFHEKYDGGKLPMKPGVVELLSALKEEQIPIALASSTRRASVEMELTDAGLLGYFDGLVCGDMVQRSKPDPEIFLKACELLGAAPERAYAIEDSYNGIRAASSGGMHPIMVPDMAEPTEEMERLAEVILSSLYEVREYLLA